MRREYTLKNYWLQLISLAMDINLKLNESRIFVRYSPHVENIELSFREKDWVPGIYGHDIWIAEEDNTLLSLMEDVVKGGRDYRDLYEYVTENYRDNGGLKK